MASEIVREKLLQVTEDEIQRLFQDGQEFQ